MKMYRCDFCVAVFSDKENLSLHSSVHNDAESPDKAAYRCKYCRYFRTTPEEVVKHEETCQANMSVWNLCSFCAMSFPKARPAKYVEHLVKKHPGVGPLFCAQCFKGFTNRPDLVAHEKEVHPSEEEEKSDPPVVAVKVEGAPRVPKTRNK